MSVVAWLLPAYAAAITCPSGFTHRKYTSFEWCYSPTRRTKADAAAECAHHGLQLLEVRSRAKRDAVYSVSYTSYTWIGLRCRGQNQAKCDNDLSKWSWDSDGASLTCTGSGKADIYPNN